MMHNKLPWPISLQCSLVDKAQVDTLYVITDESKYSRGLQTDI